MLVSIPGWHMVPSGVGGWGHYRTQSPNIGHCCLEIRVLWNTGILFFLDQNMNSPTMQYCTLPCECHPDPYLNCKQYSSTNKVRTCGAKVALSSHDHCGTQPQYQPRDVFSKETMPHFTLKRYHTILDRRSCSNLGLSLSLMEVNHPIRSIGLHLRISLMKTTVLVVKNKTYYFPLSKSNTLLQ